MTAREQQTDDASNPVPRVLSTISLQINQGKEEKSHSFFLSPDRADPF